MAVRSHIDFFATLTPALVQAVSTATGRPCSRDETATRVTRELRAVIDRWTAYGEWVEYVNSGAWLQDYQRRKDAADHARPLGARSCVHSKSTRRAQSAAGKAYWAGLTAEERAARTRSHEATVM